MHSVRLVHQSIHISSEVVVTSCDLAGAVVVTLDGATADILRDSTRGKLASMIRERAAGELKPDVDSLMGPEQLAAAGAAAAAAQIPQPAAQLQLAQIEGTAGAAAQSAARSVPAWAGPSEGIRAVGTKTPSPAVTPPPVMQRQGPAEDRDIMSRPGASLPGAGRRTSGDSRESDDPRLLDAAEARTPRMWLDANMRRCALLRSAALCCVLGDRMCGRRGAYHRVAVSAILDLCRMNVFGWLASVAADRLMVTVCCRCSCPSCSSQAGGVLQQASEWTEGMPTSQGWLGASRTLKSREQQPLSRLQWEHPVHTHPLAPGQPHPQGRLRHLQCPPRIRGMVGWAPMIQRAWVSRWTRAGAASASGAGGPTCAYTTSWNPVNVKKRGGRGVGGGPKLQQRRQFPHLAMASALVRHFLLNIFMYITVLTCATCRFGSSDAVGSVSAAQTHVLLHGRLSCGAVTVVQCCSVLRLMHACCRCRGATGPWPQQRLRARRRM
jgi:hypothetical protein